jgi:hypothetical protein
MATSNYSGYLSNYYKKPSYNRDTYNQTRTAAPTTTAAPTNVNYGGARDYGSYARQNSTGMYGDYLKREYADPTKLATNEKGETAYDMQRQRVTGDVEAERARQQEDLQRKLAASGMQDSGLAFKQNRMLAKDLGEYGGRQKSDIAIEEMSARERQATRLGEQAFSSEEAGKDRAESQRQFDSDQNLRVALQGNANAMRAWTEGNKQAFDTWIEENNINKDDADRFWDTEMGERDIESNLSQALATRDFEDYIAAGAEGRKNKTSYYFTSGQAGSMSEEDIAALQESDPNAYYAYRAGQEGKTVEQAEADNQFRDSIRDSLIVNADDPTMVATLLDIAKRNNLNVGDWESETSGTPPADGVKVPVDSTVYKARLRSSKPLTTTATYKTGGGVDNGWYFDNPPTTGEDFSFNGKLYRRTDDAIQRDQSGPNKYETEYIMVEDVETGKVLRLDAKVFSDNAHIRKSRGGNTFPYSGTSVSSNNSTGATPAAASDNSMEEQIAAMQY